MKPGEALHEEGKLDDLLDVIERKSKGLVTLDEIRKCLAIIAQATIANRIILDQILKRYCAEGAPTNGDTEPEIDFDGLPEDGLDDAE